MELTVIGSGTGVPSLRRGSPCLAVRAGGRLLVMDLGAGSLRALLRCGFDFSAIDVLALTHLHPDHVGDLIPFLFATRYSLGYTRTEPFRLLAARGFARFHDRLKEAFAGWVEPPPGLMDLKELAPDAPDAVGDLNLVIKSAPTNHTEGSLAFRVETPGKSLVYSGDTDCERLSGGFGQKRRSVGAGGGQSLQSPGPPHPCRSRPPGGRSRCRAPALDPLLSAL